MESTENWEQKVAKAAKSLYYLQESPVAQTLRMQSVLQAVLAEGLLRKSSTLPVLWLLLKLSLKLGSDSHTAQVKKLALQVLYAGKYLCRWESVFIVQS